MTNRGWGNQGPMEARGQGVMYPSNGRISGGAYDGYGPPGAPPPATPAHNNRGLVHQVQSLEQALQQSQSEVLSLRNLIEQSQRQIGSLLNNSEGTREKLQHLERQQQWPNQFRHGVVRYPNLMPFPQVLQLTLTSGQQTNFGITNAACQARITIDVDHPTILQAVSADIHKVVNGTNTGLIGTFLPLSSKRSNLYDPAGTLQYQGRDFQWRVRTASNSTDWQEGWRSSYQLDGDDCKGYVYDTEYEFRRFDTVIIEAQPIGPVPDPAQEYQLNFYLHIYKMMARSIPTETTE